ncbi:MAG: carbohydrate-binding domain-containing protein, partial [Lachnospiraceae bacterium]|nr:carbohydrate-binding domain-containing protein [Lachnospiraceae bacterium]
MKKQIIGILTATFMILPLAACGASKDVTPSMSGSSQIESQSSQASTASASGSYTPLIDASDLFSDRDRQQTADTSAAESVTLSDGKDITITKAGVYLVKGSANNATIIVDAGDDDEIQLVLDSVSITNEDAPAIYVKNAGKTYVTTTGSVSTLTTTGTFTANGSTEIDAVIFSRDDLVLNGTSTLKISSTDNAVKCNDDIRVTGGTYIINCDGNAFAAHNSIAVAGGDFTLNIMEDGFHAKDSDDDTKGFVFISGGTFDITADQANEGDGIHGTTLLQIDGGTFQISAGECIEATVIQINGGTFDLYANDDGINASNKSASYTPVIEVNGGDITLEMAQGDTDGFDSNG